jgi:hypothetical protein
MVAVSDLCIRNYNHLHRIQELAKLRVLGIDWNRVTAFKRNNTIAVSVFALRVFFGHAFTPL